MADTITKLRPIPDYGILLSLDDFHGACEQKLFIDYDGYGEYATAEGVSDLTVHPSQHRQPAPEWATHVMWYNR